MSASVSRLDHPTSSLRGPPSPSPPPANEELATSNEHPAPEGAQIGLVRSPGNGGVKRRAEEERTREKNNDSPATSLLGLHQQQHRASRSPSASHPSHLIGDDHAKRRRIASGSSSKDQHSDPTVDFDKPPISPVVLGFNLANTDPGVRDTVRSALKMKEQQQLIIQQRRGGEGPSSAASTPPHPSSKIVAGGSDSPAGETAEKAMDVDAPPPSAPAVEVQSASPGIAPTGFSSGGLATRAQVGGRVKAGGLSIRTPTTADTPQIGKGAPSPLGGGPSPKPTSARSNSYAQVPSHSPGFYPPPQQQYPPQASQPQPRSTSSASQQNPSGGPLPLRPSLPSRGPPSGYLSNGTLNGHGLPSPGYRADHPSPYIPATIGRPPTAALYNDRGGQPSPPSPSSSQRHTFLAPFERFYDALVDSRTLQQTLADISVRADGIARRGEEEIRRFQHNHQQAANLLNTLQVSSTSLQEMVRKEVAVVREETRREVESIWKRVRQLEDGFTTAGLPVPPSTPLTSASAAAPSAAAAALLSATRGSIAGKESSATASSSEDDDGFQGSGSQDGAENGGKGRQGSHGTRGGRAPKGVRGGRIGG